MNINNSHAKEDTPWVLAAGKNTSRLIGMKNRRASNNSLDSPFLKLAGRLIWIACMELKIWEKMKLVPG